MDAREAIEDVDIRWKTDKFGYARCCVGDVKMTTVGAHLTHKDRCRRHRRAAVLSAAAPAMEHICRLHEEIESLEAEGRQKEANVLREHASEERSHVLSDIEEALTVSGEKDTGRTGDGELHTHCWVDEDGQEAAFVSKGVYPRDDVYFHEELSVMRLRPVISREDDVEVVGEALRERITLESIRLAVDVTDKDSILSAAKEVWNKRPNLPEILIFEETENGSDGPIYNDYAVPRYDEVIVCE